MIQTKPRSLDSILQRMLLLRLFLPLLALTLVAIGIGSYLGGRNLETRQLQLAHSLAHTVESYLDQAGRVLDTVARMAEMSLSGETTHYMEAAWQGYGYFDTLYQLDENGVITLLAPSDPRYQGLDMSNQVYIPSEEQNQQVKTQNGVIISHPFTSLRTGQPTVYMARSLSTGGMVVGELNLGALQENIAARHDETDSDSIFITDQTGTVLAHPQTDLVAQQANLGNLEIVQRGLTDQVTIHYTDNDGDFVLGSSVPVEQTGWVVVIQAPLFIAYGPFVGVMGFVLLFSPIIWLVIVWGLGEQFNAHIVTPLRQLSQGADALAAGDFIRGEALVTIPSSSSQIDTATFAELETLAVNFRRMSQAIQARQEALQESEAKYRELVQNANSIIMRLDNQGRITFFNQFARNFFGYTKEEIIGRHVVGTIVPAREMSGRDLTVMVRDALQNPEQFARNENENIRRNGERVWVAWANKPIFDDEGRVDGILCVGSDITDRKQMEATLAEERNLLRTLIDNLPDYIYVKDTQSRFIMGNKAVADIMGATTPGGLIDKTDFDFFPEEFAAKFYADEQAIMQSGQAFINQEEQIIDPDGNEQWIITTKIPLRDNLGEVSGIVGIGKDISERKRAEAERETLITELEAKNAELERFTYTVSHDLKSPLVTIRGFLGLLKEDVVKGDAERVQGDIKHIHDATEKMKQLLDELLELSRIGRLLNPPQKITLSELVREAAELVAGQIAKRQVLVDISPNLPVVFGDRPRLLEVLQNLIDNAVKYMGDQPEPRIEIGTRPADDKTVCYIRDNGVGIDPRYHEKIFGLFERLDQETEGTGIGLALVKRIIEVHGGRIWVESEGQGQGSTFYFTLPNNREL